MLTVYTKLLLWSFVILSALTTAAESFSWGTQRRMNSIAGSTTEKAPSYESRTVPVPMVDRFATALSELQELESKPLCHRIAARLLVNNCQLINGQNDVHTRSNNDGEARDFVDAYAISLAICDLERGSFVIPRTCSHFRESTLAEIPVPVKPQLHVSTHQITECLGDLAPSDAAWNTWVNYRHQAMRFCQASLSENQRDHDIRLYQRLTKILDNLTSQLDVDIEARFESLNKMYQEATASVENLGPHMDHIESKLRKFDEMINVRLSRNARESHELAQSGLEHAGSLQQLLATLIQTAVNNAASLAAAHEHALESAAQSANDQVAIIMAALAAAAVSSNSLQDQIVASNNQMAEISDKQATIGMELDRLDELAKGLSTKFETHDGRLERAQQRAEQILGVLDDARESASLFKNSFVTGIWHSSWWPYVLCPVASLVMGSYGLEPSAIRNIWLVGLREIAGFIISTTSDYVSKLLTTPEARGQTSYNATFQTADTAYYSNIFPGNDFKQRIYAHGE